MSEAQGTGGRLKAAPEDFIVREITASGKLLMEDRPYTAQELGITEAPEGKFTTFVLQKKDWDTVQVLIRLAKYSARGMKSTGYAGVKDKRSISVQLASIFGAEPAQVLATHMKDVKINGAWKTAQGVEMGSNIGNSFSARITECTKPDNVKEIVEQLQGRMPNYYDKQRFGNRMNNPDVGIKIMHNDFEGAMMEFLTNTNMEKNEESVVARKRLAQERDFKAALEYFPKSLRTERGAIEYMSRYDNPANAMRKLPRGVLLMFIHSVQSLIFNNSIEQRIREQNFKSQYGCKGNAYGFPDMSQVSPDGDFAVGSLPGYETKDELISDYDRAVMEKMGITKEDFKIKGMPELSSKGALRVLLCPVKDLAYQIQENSAIKVEFSIPAGAYATIMLGEITKSA